MQQHIVERILHYFPDLTDRDVKSLPMGVTGEDIWLSEKAFGLFPYGIESKNTEKLVLWKSLSQAEQRTRKGIPVLVFSRNRSKVYAVIELDHLLELNKVIKNNRIG